MSKAIVVDGNSMMFRAFYATYKQLEYYKQNNLPYTNALRTMSIMLNNLLEQDKYDYAIIAFDHKEKSFRHQKYEEYKGNRKKTPEELIEQIHLIHDMSGFLGFNVYCVPGIEADDVVGSVSKKLSKENIKVDIFSSDKDMLQLVDNNINVHLFKSGISETIVNTIDNFKDLNDGLEPLQIIDYKALAGDSSDNIQGVKGIGKKTAIDLIKEYKSIEGIYNNINAIKSKSVQEKLINDKDSAFFSKEIATILTEEYKTNSINDFSIKEKDIKGITNIIDKYNLNSLRKII